MAQCLLKLSTYGSLKLQTSQNTEQNQMTYFLFAFFLSDLSVKKKKKQVTHQLTSAYSF